MIICKYHYPVLLLTTCLTAGPPVASAELTSRSAPELARVLKEHVDADKNKDGILSFEEFDQFHRTHGDKKPANPLSMELNNGDLLITDFEENNLGKMNQWGWKINGQAFQHDVNAGTKMMKRRTGSFGGRYLLTSYHKSDAMTGDVLSPEFAIARPYINFLISGGKFAERECVSLIIDGNVVRSATGRNDDRFEPVAFDVTEFHGEKAQLAVVDAHRGLWGHVNVDRIVQTKNPGTARVIAKRPEKKEKPAGLVLSVNNDRLAGSGTIRDGKLHVADQSLDHRDVILAVCDHELKAESKTTALRMIDGEVWTTNFIGFEAGKLTIKSKLVGSREIPLKNVASLEFAPDSDSAVAAAESGTLYRTNGEPIPGKLIWVRDKDVAIDCALGIVPLPREVVTRFVFSNVKSSEARTLDEVALTDGTQLFGSVRFEGNELIVSHTALGELKLPWTSVRHLRRADSKGSIAWLDLLEPKITERRGPGLPPPAPEVMISTGRESFRALRTMPRTVVSFDVPPSPASGKQTLRTQLAPVPGCRSDISVRVLQKGAELWKGKVGANDKAIALSIELPGFSAGDGGLTIEVDFAGPLAFPCGVDWRDAHVVNLKTEN